MFEQRARGTEILDRPDGEPALVRRSYRLMRFVNRAGGGIRAVEEFLEPELVNADRGKTVRVLDLGSGDCDIPLAVSRWARRRGFDVEFLCVDHNDSALDMARERIGKSGDGRVKLEKADIFAFRSSRQFDYAVGSMFFHHLTGGQIDTLMEHLRGFVRRAVLINDLHRDLLNYAACYMLTVGADREIRHDALLSVRRGFKADELRAMLAKHDATACVRRRWFRRVAGVVRFDRTEGE